MESHDHRSISNKAFIHYLLESSALNFDVRVQRQGLDSDASRQTLAELQKVTVTNNLRSAGLDITPVGGVNLVHLGKVVHVGEEDVDLDDLLQAGAGGLKNGREVLDALVLVKLAISSFVRCSFGNIQCEPGYHHQ